MPMKPELVTVKLRSFIANSRMTQAEYANSRNVAPAAVKHGASGEVRGLEGVTEPERTLLDAVAVKSAPVRLLVRLCRRRTCIRHPGQRPGSWSGPAPQAHVPPVSVAETSRAGDAGCAVASVRWVPVPVPGGHCRSALHGVP